MPRTRPDGFTRREILKAAIAAAGGMLLDDRISPVTTAAGRRVIIVGAGFSGLAAARELRVAGYDVVVVEARNRVGGRVLSLGQVVPGKAVEAGGELIGGSHLTWVALARRFGLTLVDVEDGEEVFEIEGKRVAANDAPALRAQIAELKRRLAEDARRIENPLRPWATPGADALDRRSLAGWLGAMADQPMGVKALAARFSADNGVPAAWQSYLGNLSVINAGGGERFWTDSELWRCDGGNQQLALKLLDAIGRDRVRLGAPITSILTSADRAVVTLQDGTRLEGDDVVLTIPPSVWYRVAFDPPLPPSLRPQMGSNVKFLIALRSPLWPTRAPELLSDGAVQMTWQATSGTGRGATALVAFSGGTSADTCREWTAAERNVQLARHLKPFLNGFDPAKHRVEYRDWLADPWARASYSFPAPGQVTTLGPIIEGGLGRLHFAGEYACYGFIGYMEGALRSGVMLAERLAKRDGVGSTPSR